MQEAAKNCGKLQDHLARRVGIEAHQRRDRIQGIKEKMWIDLILQGRHARLQ